MLHSRQLLSWWLSACQEPLLEHEGLIPPHVIAITVHRKLDRVARICGQFDVELCFPPRDGSITGGTRLAIPLPAEEPMWAKAWQPTLDDTSPDGTFELFSVRHDHSP